MARGVVSQSDQYGIPAREASVLPPESEFASLLGRPGITSGLLNTGSASYDQDEL